MIPFQTFSRYLSVVLLLSFVFASLNAQNKYTLSGYIADASNSENLIGAAIYVKDEQSKGTVSNLYGFYSLTLPEGNYTFLCSYLGYQTVEFQVDMSKDVEFNIELPVEGIMAEEIVVKSERKDENVSDTKMGTVELSVSKIKTLPAFMGEVDVLKTIQLLPGVQSAGEGNAGFYVRGGGPDQNLILLDDATVYNSGHLFGFFSVFNADALKNTTLIKGGMPAQYGGRLSSVLDITMKEGNKKRFQVDGGVGLIASRLTLQGPIVKGKSSFIVSARRTYALDLAQPAIDNTDFAGTNYHFYDLNAKINYEFSNKDRLFLSGYFGRDVFTYKSAERGFDVGIPWGNATGTIRWNHLFSDKLFMNTTLLYNDYDFEFRGGQDDFYFQVFSGVRDWSAKVDLDYFPNIRNKIKFGGQYTYHIFTPNSATGQAGDTEFETTLSQRFANEGALYVQDEIELTDRIKVNAGLRFSLFQHVGPYDELINDGADTIKYDNFESIKTYTGIEPRINFRYKIDNTSSVKASFAVANQYLHLVSNSASTLPTDVWVPSSVLVEPQRGTQYSLGYFKNFKKDAYETSVEIFYRDMKNQLDYGESYVPEFGEELERSFVVGRGRAYGLELFLKKAQGDFNGWIGYTYSRTERIFDDENEDFQINGGEWYPARYDRTHDVSVALNYSPSDKWTFGGVFVYGTGNAITLVEQIAIWEDKVGIIYGDRNSRRIKPYHRIDLSATYTPKPNKTKGLISSFNFSIYNVYNRRNVYFTYFDTNIDEAGTISNTAYEVSIFPIIPSITWNFKY